MFCHLATVSGEAMPPTQELKEGRLESLRPFWVDINVIIVKDNKGNIPLLSLTMIKTRLSGTTLSSVLIILHRFFSIIRLKAHRSAILAFDQTSGSDTKLCVSH